MSSHATSSSRSWPRVVTGWPWVTVVLITALVLGGIELLRPGGYTAEATLSAPDAGSADRASTLLAGPDLVDRVEEEVELGQQWRGRIDLRVRHDAGSPEVVVLGSAPDPRLAALAADTAAALVVTERGDGLQLTQPAAVPTESEAPGTLSWAWAGLLALAGALWAEGAHRRWSREHAGSAPKVDR